MPRNSRIAPGGMVYHVLNRGVGRQRLFSKSSDYAAFEDVLETATTGPVPFSHPQYHRADFSTPRLEVRAHSSGSFVGNGFSHFPRCRFIGPK
jgi:hypothetical protein